MHGPYWDYIKIFSVIYWQSQSYCARHFKDLGVTCGQFMYILCICDNPGVSQEKVAELTCIDKSTVAKAVQQLLKGGFITRQVSSEDRRVNELYPTEKAIAICPKINEIVESFNEQQLSGLTDIERDIFMRLLRKIFEDVKENVKPKI